MASRANPSVRELAERFEREADLMPAKCRWNHRAMWCDFRLRMFATPARRVWLLSDLSARCDALMCSPFVEGLPPNLWRRPDETAEQYLTRCYASAEGRYTTRDVRHSEFESLSPRTSKRED